MKLTTTLMAAVLPMALLGCGANNGDGGTGPQLPRCVDLTVEQCGLRPDCVEVWGEQLTPTDPDGWCRDPDGVREPVACILDDPQPTPGVLVYATPIGETGDCYEFRAPWDSEGTWESCLNNPGGALPCS